uniref:Uncharacterized protein n=1 Tax=Anguilla anguilla TaxID=7936 RepID=A0A0E9TXB7_ANGAN
MTRALDGFKKELKTYFQHCFCINSYSSCFNILL